MNLNYSKSGEARSRVLEVLSWSFNCLSASAVIEKNIFVSVEGAMSKVQSARDPY